MARHILVALLVSLAALPGCRSDNERINKSLSIREGTEAEDLATINGGIQIGENASARHAKSINGAIELAPGSKVSALETVNGQIWLRRGARVAQDVKSVNGPVSLDDSARVTGNVSTVNGAITLDPGAEIFGRVASVNGPIQLKAAQVGGGIHTVSGNIDVGANSHVDGGILVSKPDGAQIGAQSPPRVVIGPGAVVEGILRFEREVKLYVSEQATVGQIEGASAEKYTGTAPRDF
jgi:cytoskeletal protein CcmA (bactofilin family)